MLRRQTQPHRAASESEQIRGIARDTQKSKAESQASESKRGETLFDQALSKTPLPRNFINCGRTTIRLPQGAYVVPPRSSLLTRHSCPCGKHFTAEKIKMSRDIAAEAYQDAVRYLEMEFKADSETLVWLSRAKRTSLDDLRATTQDLETQYRASRSKHGKMHWINGFSSRVMHYGKVLDTLAQHHPEYVGLVWGIIKFVLMGIISHGELVEQFSQALSMISEVLPMTKVSAELYQTEQMKDAIGKLYTHILLFLKQALEWYKMGPASRVFKALFKPFQLSYKDTVDQIKLCAQTIDSVSNIGLKSEVREMNLMLQSESQRLQEREKNLHQMQLEFRAAQERLATMVGSVLQIAKRDTVSLTKMQLDIGDMKPWLQDMQFSHVLGALKPARTPEAALLKHRLRHEPKRE
ncbi:hypothetical protein CGMCC3_g16548 [Colletotrichum fructicola]|nr:uncharacterized protein CGMCC3_g16548 [Colletotrichum fructicola]KAE9567310.1 hypothetical protein CGMCC3_g16548 [Colletotrichum fructicola]